jgi:Lon protease-like protein
MGVVARIIDWHQRHDGLLGITAIGEQRFRIASVRIQDNQLAVAKVELLGGAPSIELPDRYLPLVDMLMRLIESAGHHYASLPRHYADANWVSYRLLELLPIEMGQKQFFLEMDDPLARLEELYQMLEGMQVV